MGSNDGRLSGMVSVVTGGGSGIGRGIVERFLAEGARVVVGDISFGLAGGPKYGSERKENLTNVLCDVTDEANVRQLMATAADFSGGVDVLVNVAGIVPPRQALIHETTIEDWHRVLSVNLTGSFLCIKHVIAPMRARGAGSIINIASTGAVQPSSPGSVAYAASKGGIAALTRELVLELSPLAITINSIAPGFITTPLTAGFSEQWQEERRSAIPIGRAGQPADVAGCAVFLASSDARFVTGHMLVVDGGVTSVVQAHGSADIADWSSR